jgi:hypothetical protein
LIAFIIGFFAPCIDANADEANLYGNPMKIRATCYTWTGNPCYNGNYPKEGLSVAGKKEWLGKACIIYAVNADGSIGDMIGTFQFTDTGYGMKVKNSNKGTLQLGRSIDVYRDTLSGCREWIKQYGDYVYIQIVDAKG